MGAALTVLSTSPAAFAQHSAIKTPARGLGVTSPSVERSLIDLNLAVAPLGRVINPCAEPPMLASKAMAIVDQRLQLLQRMRVYPELRALADTTQRSGLPSPKVVDVRCKRSGPQLSVQELEAHNRTLDVRGREVSTAQVAFARYRIAVGH